jgi:hypothetical protein
MSIASANTKMSRRNFLRHLSIAASGVLLAGCSLGYEGGLASQRRESIVTDVKVPAGRVGSAVQEEPPGLAEFLAVSALLTGVENLDPAVGRLYLQSINESSDLAVSFPDWLAQAQSGRSTLPATLAELEESGIFEEEATRKVADKITEYWYTGVYTTAQGEQAVATYVDALAWKTLAFTKAMSVCGSYRFWTEPPESIID